jgi:3-methyladenine DNA glycosylase AlkC
MVDTEGVERRVYFVTRGFKEMREQAREIAAHSSVPESLRVAKEMHASDRYQVRMVAVFVLGYVASRSSEAFRTLRKTVSKDGSWQVQEILAQASNRYCEGTGYGKALPTIKNWLGDKNLNAKRVVTEGPRIWNRKEDFKQHPEVAVRLLARLRDDDSECVRRSVGNALRDISMREMELVRQELATWDASDKSIALTYALASRFL